MYLEVAEHEPFLPDTTSKAKFDLFSTCSLVLRNPDMHTGSRYESCILHRVDKLLLVPRTDRPAARVQLPRGPHL